MLVARHLVAQPIRSWLRSNEDEHGRRVDDLLSFATITRDHQLLEVGRPLRCRDLAPGPDLDVLRRPDLFDEIL